MSQSWIAAINSYTGFRVEEARLFEKAGLLNQCVIFPRQPCRFSVVLSLALFLLPLPTAPAADPVSLPGGIKLESVDFERHVMGVVGRMGCNGGSCHGSFQGRGGFRMSLFSYDFDMDYDAIFDRVDPDDPDASYLLEKATLQTEHGGGKRFDRESWQYRVLREWIADGADRTEGSGNVTVIQAVPESVRLRRPGDSAQLKVLATYADGTTENVTPFCDFRINDDYVAHLSEGGMITSLNPGDTSIAVQYRGHVLATHVMVPAEVAPDFIYPKYENLNDVDQHVFAKLRQLNIVPSELSTDTQFLRRIYIDTVGTIPSPDDVRAFLNDGSAQKRAKKIDELLNRPTHAALWATKLSDITGNDSQALERPRAKRSRMWHDWFRVRLERNASWDEIVRGVLTATSRADRDPQEWIRETTAIEEAALDGFETDYADRDSLDLFWMRRNVNPQQLSEQIAAAFLGIRLQCAQCHKHPYDRWSQADYRSFANVFGQVRLGESSVAQAAIQFENQRREGITDNNRKLPPVREVFVSVDNPRRMNDPKTNRPLPAKAPGGPELDPSTDTREQLFSWLTEPGNPFFARAFVNRVWEHYFGRGIVHPVDDFSVGNPPSNERLLAALADDFERHNYDIRYLEKQILSSRTYQLSSVPNDSNRHDRRNFARSYPRRLMAESVIDVVNAALGVEQRFDADAEPGERAIQVAATEVRDGNLNYAFRVFGRPDRKTACDCERSSDPSLSQTLYMMTDDLLMRRIRQGRLRELLMTNNRLRRLQNGTMANDEVEEVLEELTLAMLTRSPTPAERRRTVEHVLRKEDGVEAMVDIVWAMLNTREFILNH